MPTTFAVRIRPHLARLAHVPRTDADLLADFVATRDENAFAELVRRHGPAVLAVCRRITRDPDDADDAFQAAFLVLARKADRVRPGEPLAAWLYGVAVRAARATLSRSHRRRSREVPTGELPEVPARTAEPFTPDDAQAVLAEVGRLSVGLRAAVVLCELEGRSRAATARELGIPEGTLSSRLAAARKVLAVRLRDRGLAAGVLAAVAASARGSHPVWSSEVSSRVTELAEAVMRTGYSIKMAGVLAVLAAVGLAGYARPAAVPETAPAPRPADPSRLIVGFPGHVRYLKPDGQEVGRLTGDQVKATGAIINTRAVGFDPFGRGPWVKVWETFAPSGRAAPDGRLPLATADGLSLLSADPAAVAPAKAKGGDKALFAGKDVPQIAAWSADGTKAIGWRSEGRLFAPNKDVNTLIDLAAGTAEPLKLPPGHRVMDWSPDGGWFLTLRAEESFSVRNGGWSVRVTLCRVSADGSSVAELAGPRDFVWHAAISPDGTKVAYGRGTTGPVVVRKGEKPVEVFNGFEVVVLDMATETRTVVFASGKVEVIDTGEMTAGVRWSPDGRRLAVASYKVGPNRQTRTRVQVCDADGGNARLVLETDPAEFANGAYPTVLDWR